MAKKIIVLEVPVDEERKIAAEKVLQIYGLTLPMAFNVLLRRIAEDQTLPLELKVPNEVTQAAIAASRKAMAQMEADLEEGGQC